MTQSHPEESAQIQLPELEIGIRQLQQRHNKLMAISMLFGCIGLIGLVCLFVQQDVVFHLMGVGLQIEQLHVPFALAEQLQHAMDQPNYLWNLLLWFGWLLLKIISAFIGAFIVVHFLKKIPYFRTKMHSFLQKLLAWLIAFILIGSGLSVVQAQLAEDEASYTQKMITYSDHIHQSAMYQYLKESQQPEAVQAYLLAQTALLHKPVDRVVAQVYANQLVLAEQHDPAFMQYGFKPEYLWTIQTQALGQALSPTALRVQPQMNQAVQWSVWAEYALWSMMIIAAVLSLLVYGIAQHLKQRLLRIADQLKNSMS